MAAADSPPDCSGGVSPGKNALVAVPLRFTAGSASRPASAIAPAPGTTAAFTSATGPFDIAVLCQLVASRRPWYAVLVHRPAGFL